MSNDQNLIANSKNPRVIFLAFGIWLVLLLVTTWTWFYPFEKNIYASYYSAYLSAAIWWLALLWGIHHLTFQFWSLFKKSKTEKVVNYGYPSVAILYLTRDDFNYTCCQSSYKQNYKNFKLYICDDSESSDTKAEINRFLSDHSSCILISRQRRTGFKAGNLNNAIDNYVTEEWILIVDADQMLPEDYLSKAVRNLPSSDEKIAFVQIGHKPETFPENSQFQNHLSPEIALFYSRDLSIRQDFGFVPFLGHGSLISKLTWNKLGKFPELVSEDFAYALRASAKGFQGVYIDDFFSYEAYPYDFGGFMLRLKKYSGGTAELLRKEFLPFIFSRASGVEKWDFGMQIFWYFLSPFVVINGFLGAFTLHKLWNEDLKFLHPGLPYLYSFILLALLSINLSITQDWLKGIKFYFWATAVYAASLPLTGIVFIKHLFSRPTFNRTPKNSQVTHLSFSENIFMIVLGVTALSFALVWWSPFSIVLIGIGISYISFPLYGQLNSRSVLGLTARKIIYLPGVFYIIAIIFVWVYTRY